MMCGFEDVQIAKTEDLIVQLTFQFALAIVVFTERLEQKRKFNPASQLFRSGTSIGANVREARGCESKNDFIHKMKIAYQETEETRYWLEICAHSENDTDPGQLMNEITSILRVLGKIISTSKS